MPNLDPQALAQMDGPTLAATLGIQYIGPDELASLGDDESATSSPSTRALTEQLAEQQSSIPAETMARLLALDGQPARSRSRGRPAATPEPAPPDWDEAGQGIMVDRFDANPAVSYIKALMPGAKLPGKPPTMFASGSGDLPAFTGSGIDVELLWWAPWMLRHAAAFTTSRRVALTLCEEGSDDPLPQRLQTREGNAALTEYTMRCFRWATPPTPIGKASEQAVAALFPPGTKPL